MDGGFICVSCFARLHVHENYSICCSVANIFEGDTMYRPRSLNGTAFAALFQRLRIRFLLKNFYTYVALR